MCKVVVTAQLRQTRQYLASRGFISGARTRSEKASSDEHSKLSLLQVIGTLLLPSGYLRIKHVDLSTAMRRMGYSPQPAAAPFWSYNTTFSGDTVSKEDFPCTTIMCMEVNHSCVHCSELGHTGATIVPCLAWLFAVAASTATAATTTTITSFSTTSTSSISSTSTRVRACACSTRTGTCAARSVLFRAEICLRRVGDRGSAQRDPSAHSACVFAAGIINLLAEAEAVMD